MLCSKVRANRRAAGADQRGPSLARASRQSQTEPSPRRQSPAVASAAPSPTRANPRRAKLTTTGGNPLASLHLRTSEQRDTTTQRHLVRSGDGCPAAAPPLPPRLAGPRPPKLVLKGAYSPPRSTATIATTPQNQSSQTRRTSAARTFPPSLFFSFFLPSPF